MLYAAKQGPELGRLGHTWAAHAADTVAAASVCASASRHMLSVTSENVSPAETCLSAGALATPLAKSTSKSGLKSLTFPLDMAISCHRAKEALHHILAGDAGRHTCCQSAAARGKRDDDSGADVIMGREGDRKEPGHSSVVRGALKQAVHYSGAMQHVHLAWKGHAGEGLAL